MAEPQTDQVPSFNDARRQQGSVAVVPPPSAPSSHNQPPSFHEARAAEKSQAAPPSSTWDEFTKTMTTNPLETANQWLSDPRGHGILTRVGQSVGRTAMMPVNVASAALSPATEEEKKQGFTHGWEQPALAAHRLVTNPSNQTETMLESQEAKDAAAGQPHSAMERYGLRAVNSIPIVGPMMINEGQRAGQGDIAGAATDVGAMVALPHVIKEAMPGGSLARGVDTATEGAIPAYPESAAGTPTMFPTVRNASSAAVRGVGTIAERITPRGLAQAGGALAAEKLGLGKVHVPGVPGAGDTGTTIGGGWVGGKTADLVLGEKARQPIVNLPGVRTFGRTDLLTPEEATAKIQSGTAGELPYKVVTPGGKTVPIEDFQKTEGLPGVKAGGPNGARGGTIEPGSPAAERLGLKAVNPAHAEFEGMTDVVAPPKPLGVSVTPKEANSVEYMGGSKTGEVIKPANAAADINEVNAEAAKEVEKMSPVKPNLDPKVEGSLRHVIGDYATDNLIDTPEGAAVAQKLKGLTYENYRDLAEYEGVLKPKSMVAKSGKQWSTSDFARSVAEHGKELNPNKEMVIRHMVDNYGPEEIEQRIGGMGRK